MRFTEADGGLSELLGVSVNKPAEVGAPRESERGEADPPSAIDEEVAPSEETDADAEDVTDEPLESLDLEEVAPMPGFGEPTSG